MTAFTMRPSQTLSFPFDWSTYLASIDDTLASATFDIEGGSVVSSQVEGAVATALVTAGSTDKSFLELTCNILTTGGATDFRTERIRIRLESLLVEDGSAMLDSESYCDTAYADFYHADHGNTRWATLTESVKEQCLRKATQYMTAKYSGLWKGARVRFDQALDWPRAGVVIETSAVAYGYQQVDYTTIPNDIKIACAEFALRASITPLIKDQNQKAISKTIGPIKVEYDPYSPDAPRYNAVAMLLRPYLMGTNVSMKLGRR